MTLGDEKAANDLPRDPTSITDVKSGGKSIFDGLMDSVMDSLDAEGMLLFLSTKGDSGSFWSFEMALRPL